MLQLRDPGVLLFSGPAFPGGRALTTVRASTGAGRTWRSVHTVDGLPAAYGRPCRGPPEPVAPGRRT
ncbi:hypothetical protein [Streptomyces sp. NPDC001480]|uniref:hypothetical protein n=1 Tax=Streptomyces sp. NPDC001480 TaxID=3364577 RepID=UPI0036B38BF5